MCEIIGIFCLMIDRSPPDMIGESPLFLDALAHASVTAELDRPVLILGERGTGKELFAARMHYLSPRWDGPFVKVNCAALADSLLESELFGHDAGAFTGATKRHAGRFERADGGTLFLDEIGIMSVPVQEKLLRVIEYGEYERLGGSETLKADVRIIGATNADLPSAAKAGDFRPDLLDRLAFEVIVAPPLRKRQSDIPLLAAFFAHRFVAEIPDRTDASGFAGFSERAMRQLVAHDWPGNVRELKSAVERSVYRWIAGDGNGPVDDINLDPFSVQDHEQRDKTETKVGIDRASDKVSDGMPGPDIVAREDPAVVTDLRGHLHAEEKRVAREALSRHQWNQRKAANALGLTYDQIRGLVRKHGLTGTSRPPDHDQDPEAGVAGSGR